MQKNRYASLNSTFNTYDAIPELPGSTEEGSLSNCTSLKKGNQLS